MEIKFLPKNTPKRQKKFSNWDGKNLEISGAIFRLEISYEQTLAPVNPIFLPKLLMHPTLCCPQFPRLNSKANGGTYFNIEMAI